MPRHTPEAMAMAQTVMAKHVVFRLQDGRDIMDVQFHELRKLAERGRAKARAYARESVIANYLVTHCPYANPDPFQKAGAYFPGHLLDAAIAEADKQTRNDRKELSHG